MCPNHEECRPTLYSPFNRFLFRVNPIFSLCFGFYAVMLPCARAWGGVCSWGWHVGEVVLSGFWEFIYLLCLELGSMQIFKKIKDKVITKTN